MQSKIIFMYNRQKQLEFRIWFLIIIHHINNYIEIHCLRIMGLLAWQRGCFEFFLVADAAALSVKKSTINFKNECFVF